MSRGIILSLLFLLALVAPARADQTLPNAQIDNNNLMKWTGGPLLGKFNATSGGIELQPEAISVVIPYSGCTPISGGYYDSSNSWAPSCSGTYISNKPDLYALAITGSDRSGSSPDYPKVGWTQQLMQVRADNQGRAELGLFINIDVTAGHGGLSDGSNAQKVGWQVSGKRRNLSGSSNQPGSLWGGNIDVIDESTTPGFMVGMEMDYSMNNAACAPGSTNMTGCFHNNLWLTALTSYPQDAVILINTIGQVVSKGKVSVIGKTVTRTSLTQGIGFTADLTVINISGTVYRVASVANSTTATLRDAYGDGTSTYTNQDYSWSTHSAYNGLFMTDSIDGQGEYIAAVRDNDILLSTKAFTGILIQGQHQQGINTTQDSGIIQALLMKQGQQISFNGADDIQRYLGFNIHEFWQNGGTTLRISGATNGVDYLQISNATSGTGPALTVQSPAAASPLRISAVGDASIDAGSGVRFKPYSIAQLSSGGAFVCNGTRQMQVVAVYDGAGQATPTYNGIVTGGGSTFITALAQCDGSVWRYR